MTQKLSTGEFIKRANNIHNNGYDYSLVNYTEVRIKIPVICKYHGIFYPTPQNHLSKKSGCPSCAGLKNLTTEEFIQKSKLIHGDRYDYTKLSYKNNHTKVQIICPNHGEFLQSPNSHLSGCGCMKCSVKVSKLEIKWLDSLNILQENRQYKITIDKKKYIVDGYNPEIKTVYEFLGDYWHGNPTKYDSRTMNKRKNMTFGELYQKTCKKHLELKSAGYKVVEMWEADFKKVCK